MKKIITALLTGLLITGTSFAVRATNDSLNLQVEHQDLLVGDLSTVQFSGTAVEKLTETSWSFWAAGTFFVLEFDQSIYLSAGTALNVYGDFDGNEKYNSTIVRVIHVDDYEIK